MRRRVAWHCNPEPKSPAPGLTVVLSRNANPMPGGGKDCDDMVRTHFIFAFIALLKKKKENKQGIINTFSTYRRSSERVLERVEHEHVVEPSSEHVVEHEDSKGQSSFAFVIHEIFRRRKGKR